MAGMGHGVWCTSHEAGSLNLNLTFMSRQHASLPLHNTISLLHTCTACDLLCSDNALLQMRNRHLKSCARSRGLSTIQLLGMAHDRAGSPSSNDPPPVNNQAVLRSVLRKSMDDFKVPPPAKRDRKRKTPQSESMGSVQLDI